MRKVNYTNTEYVENKYAMNLQEGKRSLATGRVSGQGGWLLKANGFCWVDPAARKPNCIGKVEPSYMTVKNKNTAKKELQNLALLLGPYAGVTH